MTTSDRERVAALFDAHARAVLGYLVRRCVNADDAADALAEVFVVAWRRRSAIPAADADARLWLLGVARRVLANQSRSLRRRDRLGALIRRQVPAPAVTEPDVDPGVVEALAALDDPDRELLRLSSWEQLSAAEIAVVLGTTPGAARTRLHRARQRFRAELEARRRPGPSDPQSGPQPDPTTESRA